MKRLIFPGVLGLFFYVAILGGQYSLPEARMANTELAARQVELQDARRQIDSLRAWIDSLRTNDEALERFARERYGFIRDGEYLYRITDTAEEKDANEPR